MEERFDWDSGCLAEGLRCYRTGQFFEAHEHWEAVWLTLQEPEKSFLQALIQITAAFHHLGRGNRTGALSLLTRSLRRLDRYPTPYCSLDLESLRKQVRVSLALLQAEQQSTPMPIPEFRLIDCRDSSATALL